MDSDKDRTTIGIYAALMTEVKMRLAAIWSATHGKVAGIPSPLVVEFCFLQLRMICELVAVACLVAHEDIPATKKFTSEFAADKIMKLLTELHPDYFPRPAKRTLTEGRQWIVEPINNGFMTKEEFVNLVPVCGRVLHRSPLKKLLSPNSAVQTSFAEIHNSAQKIGNLLSTHFTARLGGAAFIHCTMQTAELNGDVQVVMAKANR